MPEQWVPRPLTSFDAIVGPFYFPASGGKAVCGFVADARHANLRGVVHGGVIATAFDVAMGTASREALGHGSHATIQLTIHFVGAMQINEFATIRSDISRATRDLVFVRGVMTVGERLIATADGIWKILR